MPAQAPWESIGGVCEPAAAYRPRHPERTPFYRIFGDHFQYYPYAHQTRFEPRYGVQKDVEGSSTVARTISPWCSLILSSSIWTTGPNLAVESVSGMRASF
jgi:hypothetical protein